MVNYPKLVLFFSLLAIVLGLVFLWFVEDPSYLPTPNPPVITVISPTKTNFEGERVFVTEVVDGDTIKVKIEGGEATIRYLGLDTPETKDPRKPVGCFGKEASAQNKKLVEGKEVYLQKDVSETDKYNRLLRFIYLPLENGEVLFVNDYLIREGYATALTIPPDVKYQEQFLQAQRQARMEKRGLWGRC